MSGKALMYVLWPSFIAAGIAETVFFTVFDPRELVLFGETMELSRTAIYSIGFFALWLVAAASSTMTHFLYRSDADANRRQDADSTRRA